MSCEPFQEIILVLYSIVKGLYKEMVDSGVNLASEQVYCFNIFSHFLHYTFDSQLRIVARSFWSELVSNQIENRVKEKIRCLNEFSLEYLPSILQDDLLKTSAYMVKNYSSSREMFNLILSHKKEEDKNDDSRATSDDEQGEDTPNSLKKRELKFKAKVTEEIDLASTDSNFCISDNSLNPKISEESLQEFLDFVLKS